MKTNFSQFPIIILNLTDDLFRVKYTFTVNNTSGSTYILYACIWWDINVS